MVFLTSQLGSTHCRVHSSKLYIPKVKYVPLCLAPLSLCQLLALCVPPRALDHTDPCTSPQKFVYVRDTPLYRKITTSSPKFSQMQPPCCSSDHGRHSYIRTFVLSPYLCVPSDHSSDYSSYLYIFKKKHLIGTDGWLRGYEHLLLS